MDAIHRLLKFIEYKEITKRQFYINTGLSNGYLDKNSNIGSNTIEKIISKYPELSIEWLVTGKGSMINPLNTTSMVAEEPAPDYKGRPSPLYDPVVKEIIDSKNQLIKSLQAQIELLEKQIEQHGQ